MMKVYFFTEGGDNIGLGHLSRCMSLYHAFMERGIRPVFFIKGNNIPSHYLDSIEHRMVDWCEYIGSIVSATNAADIGIVDSYLAPLNICNHIATNSNIVLFFDDIMRIKIPGSIIINYSIDGESYKDPENNILYLLGKKYITLKKDFWNISLPVTRNQVNSIAVTFGHNDGRNLTPPILRLLCNKYPDIIKNIIIGNGYRNRNEIEKSADKKTNLIVGSDSQDLKKTILCSDMAISAGGQTLYELLRVGLPTIAILVADNQRNNIMSLVKAGLVIYGGAWNDRNLYENIEKGLDMLRDYHLRKGIHDNATKAIDGMGARRVVTMCIREYVDTTGITLRKAGIEDMDRIFYLSNDPEVRQHSFNTEPISYTHHVRWFKEKLNSRNCLFLVVETGKELIGQIRFDCSDAEAVLSLSIDRKYRGLGIGKKSLKKAIHILGKEIPGVNYVKALVRIENDHAKNFFERCGFILQDMVVIKNYKAMVYLYNTGSRGQ